MVVPGPNPASIPLWFDLLLTLIYIKVHQTVFGPLCPARKKKRLGTPDLFVQKLYFVNCE